VTAAKRIAFVALILLAFVIGTVSAEPTQSGERIEIEMKALQGVCAASQDFSHTVEEAPAGDKRPAYYRDIKNYLAAIIVTDRNTLQASFRPAPQNSSESGTGGIETYVIERRTGVVRGKEIQE